MKTVATYIVVTFWQDGPGYRGVDAMVHDGAEAKAHARMLRKECDIESVMIVGFLGGDHAGAAQAAADAISDGARFGRKALARLELEFECNASHMG